MKRVGFFREMSYGEPDDPSIHEASGGLLADPEVVVEYLESGEVEFASPGVMEDVLEPGNRLGPLTLDTDGEWLWPSHLVHYVRTYLVSLPPEFLERIAKSA